MAEIEFVQVQTGKFIQILERNFHQIPIEDSQGQRCPIYY